MLQYTQEMEKSFMLRIKANGYNTIQSTRDTTDNVSCMPSVSHLTPKTHLTSNGIMSALYSLLDKHWLWKEINSKLQLSSPAYSYWNECRHIKLNRYVFIEKQTLPEKYAHIETSLTDLTGYLPTNYAASTLNMDSHIFAYKKMRLYNQFEYKYVNDIKFVNLKRFFTENGIALHKKSYVHLGRLGDLSITSDSRFYRIDDNYGVVVYD